jgi:anthranilate/para-aminobenzoate synthase component II
MRKTVIDHDEQLGYNALYSVFGITCKVKKIVMHNMYMRQRARSVTCYDGVNKMLQRLLYTSLFCSVSFFSDLPSKRSS